MPRPHSRARWLRTAGVTDAAAHDVRDGMRPDAVVPFRGRQLADALLHDSAIDDVVSDFGRACEQDGEGMDVCLAELDDTYIAVLGAPAPPLVVRRAALAWADATQERFNELDCVDPMTGVSSIHHIQSQLAAHYRAANEGWLADTDIARAYALVVVEISGTRDDLTPAFGTLEAALRLAAAAQAIRERIPVYDQIAELNPRRLVALARRADGLDRALAEVVDTITQRLSLSPSGGTCRGWTEPLPPCPDGARHLLDELAR